MGKHSAKASLVVHWEGATSEVRRGLCKLVRAIRCE